MAEFNIPPSTYGEAPPAQTPPPPSTGNVSGALPVNATATPQQPTGIDPGALQAANDFRAATGSGWKFSASKMDGVIKELEGHLQGYLEGINPSVAVTSQINAPGDEEASAQFAHKANVGAGQFQAFHKASTSFLRSYIDTLKQIKNAYLNQDSAALDGIKNLGIEQKV